MQSNPKLLPTARAILRVLHFSRRTEGAYLGWIRRFVRHSGVSSADDLGEETVRSFLIHLAAVRKVSPATQVR